MIAFKEGLFLSEAFVLVELYVKMLNYDLCADTGIFEVLFDLVCIWMVTFGFRFCDPIIQLLLIGWLNLLALEINVSIEDPLGSSGYVIGVMDLLFDISNLLPIFECWLDSDVSSVIFFLLSGLFCL